MQTWAWLAKCHTEVYLASVFVTDVARTGNDENLRHRYSTCSGCFPLNVPAHRNESGYLRTSSKTVSIATLHQPSSPYLRPPSPGGEGTRSGGLRGAGLRLPSPAGRRCRAAADEGRQRLGHYHPSPGRRLGRCEVGPDSQIGRQRFISLLFLLPPRRATGGKTTSTTSSFPRTFPAAVPSRSLTSASCPAENRAQANLHADL